MRHARRESPYRVPSDSFFNAKDEEDRMLRSMPQFPTLEVWQRMDESEQDALIARIETVRRRKARGVRFLISFGCAVFGTGLGLAVYLLLP